MHSLFQMGWDKNLLRYINDRWHNDFFDWLMPWLRNMETWAPFYLFFLLYVLFNYKKTGWWWLLAAVCTPVITDLVSSQVIKENIFRLRPCNDPGLASWLRFPEGIYRPQSSGFTSSHAANHFGLAMYLFQTLKSKIGKKAWFFFIWAASVCYAQIYIGVHYPIDILGGALVGLIAGYTTSVIFIKTAKGLQ